MENLARYEEETPEEEGKAEIVHRCFQVWDFRVLLFFKVLCDTFFCIAVYCYVCACAVKLLLCVQLVARWTGCVQTNFRNLDWQRCRRDHGGPDV